jgi:hypothetical protein
VSKPRKRRIVIRLTNRQKEDPQAILAAVRVALRNVDVQLQIRTVEGPPPTPEEEAEHTRRMAQEQLEAAAMSAAAAQLESNAQKLRSGQGAPAGTDVPKAEATLWERMKKLMAKGWQITVGAVLDWATKAKP